MRAFIAIPLDEEAHKELSILQERLRKANADIKWVKPSNIHLTLKFLGEIENRQAEEIIARLQDITKSQRPFYMHISNIGAFPRPSYPRVVWSGIDEGKDESANLQKLVEETMSKLGFEKEQRPFMGHLTLGRVRSLKNKNEFLELMEKEKDFSIDKRILVDRIILYRSTLLPEGPLYSPIKEFLFGV